MTEIDEPPPVDRRWSHIMVSRESGVTELRFHTNGGAFVWSAQAHRELTQAFRWIADDLATKVLILTGTGPTYCTDIDVSGFADMSWHRIWNEGRRMLSNLHDVDVPIISAVNGPATIHAEILVLADIVVAADHAEFADRAHFATRDTVPGDGVGLIWGELLGPTRTKYFLLTGESIGAHEAKRLGVVNEVVPSAELMGRARDLALDLSRRSLPVLQYTKTVMKMGFHHAFRERLSHGLGVQGCGHWDRGGIEPGRLSTFAEGRTSDG